MNDKAIDVEQHRLLYGRGLTDHIVAIEHLPGESEDSVQLFLRDGDSVCTELRVFHPFVWCRSNIGLESEPGIDRIQLAGGMPLDECRIFSTWKSLEAFCGACRKKKFKSGVDWYYVRDPVQQFMISTGETLFRSMNFEVVRRLILDVRPDESGEHIESIALRKPDGDILSLAAIDYTSEKALLERFLQVVLEEDPDVIEGYGLFRSMMPLLHKRAESTGLDLKLGRDGACPQSYRGRFSVAEKNITFTGWNLYGRQLLDTYFPVQSYDVSQRELENDDVISVARHFKLADDGVKQTVDKLMMIQSDISGLFAPVIFAQSQMLPMQYGQAAMRGAAGKIELLLLRAAHGINGSLPVPDVSRRYQGGYTDIFFEGVKKDVYHCDVRSLYPSLMLQHQIGPAKDSQGVFLKILDQLRERRIEIKADMSSSNDESERRMLKAEDTASKVLINAFYGYLGFGQARWNDYDAAAEVTAKGRELLERMTEWIRELGAQPLEIDTDGIYYAGPEDISQKEFQAAFIRHLPEGIVVEFDGHYQAMFSYKKKNYALLTDDGDIIITGGALKARSLEPFQREYIRDYISCRLENRVAEIPVVQQRYMQNLENQEWDIQKLAKTETLQESPARYQKKVAEKGRPRSAAYEVAFRSALELDAGDKVTYYIAASDKKKPLYETAKHVLEWDPENRDEDVAHYRKKLKALFGKFKPENESS